MSRQVTEAPLPPRTWTARALRDVDARGRRELAPVGKVRQVRSGEELYRQGEAADAFFVVTRGEIALERTEPNESGTGAPAVQRVLAEETFGAEPFVHPAARRTSTARAIVPSELVELSAQRVQRVALRSGAAESTLADPRLVRLALADAVARTLRPDPTRGASLLDGLTSHRLAHGEPLRATGDAAALVLHGGLREGSGERHGIGALVTLGSARELVAVDHTWVALLSPAALAAVNVAAPTGGGRIPDPARVHASRSLLVLDGEACVRCGHCVASCASSHDDGLARLVRQGAPLLHGTPFVLPGSCGHCTHAACLLECPTQAIRRDPSGAIHIHEDACTGCGRCVEACPWGNVQLATSAANRPVAVKCDLCQGEHAEGRTPACVASCPTEALVRIEVRLDEAKGGEANGGTLEEALEAALDDARPEATSPTARVELGLTALLLTAATTFAGLADARACGYAASVLFVGLGAHAWWKRRARGVARSYRAHLAMAAAILPLLVRHLAGPAAHAPGFRSLASALALASLVAVLSGMYGAVAYALVPRRLVALGDDGATPEELRRELAHAREQAFLLLTGRDERMKTWWRVRLAPYAASRVATLRFALSLSTGAAEIARLQAEIARVGQGRIAPEDARPLTEHAVATRVLAARVMLHIALRAWLPLHVASAAIALALVVRHVALHVLYR